MENEGMNTYLHTLIMINAHRFVTD